MKSIHIFDLDKYHTALSPSSHKRQSYGRQKGAGLGNIVARYSIPLVQKYILPHAKAAAVGVYRDLKGGKNVRTAIKNNAIGMVQNVGHDMLENLKGGRLRRRGNSRALASRGVASTKAKQKKIVTKKKKQVQKKNTKKTKVLSKRDIFS